MIIEALSWYVESLSAFWVSLAGGRPMNLILIFLLIYWLCCGRRRKRRHRCRCRCRCTHCGCRCGRCPCGSGKDRGDSVSEPHAQEETG